MAVDIQAIQRNIKSFYKFKEKSIIHVGAGGGQLIDYAHDTKSVLAVDPDPEAVDRLRRAIVERGFSERFKILQGEFLSVSTQADVVFFEFCLHEMKDPTNSLVHAQSLASETIIIDHLPDSPWSWYTYETEKVMRSWAAIKRFPAVRYEYFSTTQQFRNYSDLFAKVQVLGEPAINRIKKFENQQDITIEMPYGLALL